MLSDVCCKRLVPRRPSSQATHCWFNAWHTCSSVTSGFFPPQSLRLAGCERQRYQAQRQVTHQRHVVAPLEIAEADLALAGADAMLHVPASEGHAQQPP